MLSVKSIIAGIVLFSTGVGVIASEPYTGLSASSTRPFALFLMVIGFLFFLLGQTGLAALLRPPKGIHREDAAMAAIALIRAMLAIAIADREVGENEIRMTGKIYKQLTGTAMAENLIRETAEGMLAEDISIGDEMLRLNKVLDSGMKEKVLRAALFIIAADGKVEEREEFILNEIRLGLDIPGGKFKKIKRDFLKSKGLAA